MEKKMIPQFKDVQFRSKSKYEEWLAKMTYMVLQFADLGQDLSTMCLHNSGEILDCDFNEDIYNGKFVNLHAVYQGEAIEIYNPDSQSWQKMGGLIVEDFAVDRSKFKSNN